MISKMGFKHWVMIIGINFLCFLMVDSQTTPRIKCPSNHYADQRVGCKPCGKCLTRQCGAQTGTCVGGCSSGFQGDKCDMECGKGRYGKNCKSRCNPNCLNGECNSVTGTCNGCEIGYDGNNCDKECRPGTYGWKCNSTCTSCYSNDCDPQTGHCVRCPSGFIGEKCTIDCPVSTYGENCSYTCPHCSGLECNKTTGECLNGCSYGYLGDKCETEYRSFRHGLLYGAIPVASAAALAILIVVLICCLRQRQTRRKSQDTLYRIQRHVGVYTAYPVRGDKLDNKQEDLSPLESNSPIVTRKQFGSFLAKKDPKDKISNDVRLEPEGSHLPNNYDVMDGRKSGYIEVIRQPEVETDDGYLLVDRQQFPEENYENMSYTKGGKPLTDNEEIYENAEASNIGIVPRKSRKDSEPLYENF